MPSSNELLKQIRALTPHVIDLSLSRMHALLAKLEHPERNLPAVLHVAGTNGKGSVIALMRAMLEAQGDRVHAYTSPTLDRLHSSITLAKAPGASEPIAEQYLFDVLTRVYDVLGKAPATAFEAETAAAFLAFAEIPADFVLLEVGLGGRLDATNVIDQPRLSILTSISHDHSEFLGERLTDIAEEKVGILKTGTPVVVAPQPDAVHKVIQRRASELGILMNVAGQHWDAYEEHGRLIFQNEEGLADLPLPALAGRHQIENAGTAIAAMRLLGGDGPMEEAISQGLKSVKWPARLQHLGTGALHSYALDGGEIWVDGGHNASAGRALAHAMAELEELASRPLHVIVGMLITKDPEVFLEPFVGLAEAVIAVPVPENSNAFASSIQADELADAARRLGFWAEACHNLKEAITCSATRASAPPRLLICGSLHLIAHGLELNRRQLASE